MAGKAEKIALFIDFENLESGIKEQLNSGVDVDRLINKATGRGVLTVRRAYGDWGQLESYRQGMLQAGVELVETSNTTADSSGVVTKLAIDAVENALHSSAETFTIVTANATNCLPLFYKLKELGKSVVAFGLDANASAQVKSVVDYYVNCGSLTGGAPAQSKKPSKPQRIPGELLKTAAKILTEQPDYKLEAGKLKEELLKAVPNFNETTYGSDTFVDLLEFVQKKKLLPIKVETKGEKSIVQLIDEKAQKEKEEQWEDRPMTEKEWEAFMEAVEGCINEGAGRANQGKLWIINAYLHRKRLDGILPLSNNVLFSSLQALTEYGALHRTDNDCYLMTEDYQYKKEDFLDELFGVEIDEEFYDEEQGGDEAEADAVKVVEED